MKTMLEIVRLVREHMEKEVGFFGMCGTALELHYLGTINYSEYEEFKGLIKAKQPRNSRKWQRENDSLYFYEPGEKAPRRKFLNNLIKQLEKENDQSIQDPS